MIDGRSVPNNTRLGADVCIVGAGPVGITLARILAADGIDVLLMESGGLKATADAQKLNTGEIDPDSNHPPIDMYRERRFGGSSTIWGGRCIPFDPIDFEVRNYVPYSGWPIRYGDVARFYDDALHECEAGAFKFGENALCSSEPFIEGLEISGGVNLTLEGGIERYSPPTNFARRYSKVLLSQHNLRIVIESTCIELETRNGGGHVDVGKFATSSGNRFTVAAKVFVVASGGLETVRLFAASTRDHSAGLGNSHDLLGRFYMCHIEGTVGKLRLTPGSRRVAWNFERTIDGVFARRRLRLSDKAQNERNLRNTIFRLHHANPVDPSHRNAVLSLMYFAKQFILPEYRRKITSTELVALEEMPKGVDFWRRHVLNVITGMPTLAAFIPKWILGRHLKYRRLPYVALQDANGAYPVDFNAEQEPNPDSRVTVSDQRDHFGQLKLNVSWKATEQDVASIEESYLEVDAALRHAGVGCIDFGQRNLRELLSNCGPVGGHHIGTVRMGCDERTGVVDSDCRVFEVDNVYAVGSAIFPTCSHANPTLTALALTLRLADHLKRTLPKRETDTRSVDQ
ncbi:FAD-dependent oxidoreductase [Methylobacterium flocculans]|uniref:FAD-dependent oxidoreductase n=1 Tax=Methylobacterium flocculans TaxID=2984843 RepID=UPI0021F2BC73|nr:FAD-dependent oxidoreductase [Methylobacterium sp. FF17]